MHPQEIIARSLYEKLEALSDERPFVSYDTAAGYEADTIFADRIAYMHKIADSIVESLYAHGYDIRHYEKFKRSDLKGKEEDT